VAEQDGALRMAAGQAFYNVSEFTLAKLKASAAGQRLRDDFIAYLDGFSPNVQEILTKFNFRNQIQKLVDSHVLGYLIDDFLDPEVNLAPLPVKDADGRIKLPALDNHGMGTVFEELIRRFNEDNNEEAGEHFTPRDVVQLMAKLLFLPVADRIESSTYSLYDGSRQACITLCFEAVVFLVEPFISGLAGVDGAALLWRDCGSLVSTHRAHTAPFLEAGAFKPKNTGPDQWLPVMRLATADRLLKRCPWYSKSFDPRTSTRCSMSS
jgi:hypothetical protein